MFRLRRKKIELLAIANYWAEFLKEKEIVDEINEVPLSCWRCKTTHQVAAYPIVSKTWWKNDDPSNLMILCLPCQQEKPEVATADIVWRWLESGSDRHYWVLQAMAEYEKLYHISVLQELWDMGIRDGEEVERLVEKVFKLSRKRGGVANRATLAGIFHCEIEKMRRKVFTNWTGVFRTKLPNSDPSVEMNIPILGFN